MKVPLSWLQEHLKTSSSVETIAEHLTMVGLEVDGVQESKQEAIFEISLTPNLVHAASMRGVARELAAIENSPLLPITLSCSEDKTLQTAELIAVDVQAPKECARYSARVMTEVKVAPSPAWLQKRLEDAGMRPVNNVVDATNYVMLELGQPLHAFDLEKLAGKTLVVRRGQAGESIETLDGQTRYLSEQMLVIADTKKAVAVAGVMGSAESEVSNETSTIVIESAYFEPTQVRRTSKALQLKTDASYRFERGTDPNMVLQPLERVCQLIQELGGGKVASSPIDCKTESVDPWTVHLRLARVNQLLGTQLSQGEVEAILKRLTFTVKTGSDQTFEVTVPTYRHDVTEEIDLVEEVARLYGYQNLPEVKNPHYRPGSLPSCPGFLFERKIRELMFQEGLQEVITCNLISPSQSDWIQPSVMPDRALIKLLNPSSVDHSIMRPSLLPGMVSAVKYNLDRQVSDFTAFEVGRIHFKSKQSYLEPTMLSVLLASPLQEASWHTKKNEVDFFDLKGIIENLLAALKIEQAAFVPSSFANFHPKQQTQIVIRDNPVGLMGQLHPSALSKHGITKPLFFAELNLEDLLALSPGTTKMEPLATFPASTRDWTLTLPEGLEIATINALIKKGAGPLLESFTLKDLYHNNATFHFVYRDHTKTVDVKSVEKEHEKILKHVLLGLSKES